MTDENEVTKGGEPLSWSQLPADSVPPTLPQRTRPAIDPEAQANDLSGAFAIIERIRREERASFVALLRARAATSGPHDSWLLMKLATEWEQEWGTGQGR